MYAWDIFYRKVLFTVQLQAKRQARVLLGLMMSPPACSVLILLLFPIAAVITVRKERKMQPVMFAVRASDGHHEVWISSI